MKKHDFWCRAGALLLALALTVSLVPTAAAAEKNAKISKFSVDNPENLGENRNNTRAVDDTAPGEGEPSNPGVTVTIEDFATTMDAKGSTTLKAIVTPETDAYLIEWSSSNETVAKIDKTSGVLTPLTPGKARITAEVKGVTALVTAFKDITVSGLVMDQSDLVITASKAAALSEEKIGVQRFGNAEKGELVWSSNAPTIAQVDGTTLKGVTVGQTFLKATVGEYTASRHVVVEENVALPIPWNMEAGETLAVPKLLEQLKRTCQDVTESSLAYLTGLSVSPNEGILYYGYVSSDDPGAGVGSTERYYVTPGNGQLDISKLVFSPKIEFSGTAVIRYTGFSTSGGSFTGQIRVEVKSSPDVLYTTSVGIPIKLQGADFSAVCRNRTGRDINYITFTPPSAKRGTIYYSYTGTNQYSDPVDADTRYSRTRAPYLDELTFVPAEGYAGTLTVPYRCVDTANGTYDGQLTIVVTGEGSEAGTGGLSYTVQSGGSVDFVAGDFDEACMEQTGETLASVSFSLPDSRKGVLYYNYSGAGNRVTAGTRYYSGGTPSLSDITFVPAGGFVGTVFVSYTGYTVRGLPFQGTVKIQVTSGGDTNISYYAQTGRPITFSTADFDRICKAETGRNLDYVQFTQPAAGDGTLCYNYRSGGSYESKVDSKTKYYRAGTPSLGKVTFLPSGGRTVSIPFTGYAVGGGSFQGVVEIRGETTQAVDTIRYTTSGDPVRVTAADLKKVCSAALGTKLTSVEFTSLPYDSIGRLYSGYVSPSQMGEPVAVGVGYYDASFPGLDQFYFIPRAGASGTAAIRYTGADLKGNRFNGAVEITVEVRDRFQDMKGYGWAASAVEYLYQNDITTGVSATRFGPAQKIKRGDFVLMLCRAFGFSSGGSAGFSDVSAGSYYAWAVAAAREQGVVLGSGGKFMPEQNLTRQDAMVMIQRAMEADGWSVSASESVLSSFRDGDKVAGYARAAAAALVKLGVISGNDRQELRPTDAISRAEMAVILYRVLTR